jgi:hypothetical protein
LLLSFVFFFGDAQWRLRATRDMIAYENRLRVLQGHVLQSPIVLDKEALVSGASSDDALMNFRSKYATRPEGLHSFHMALIICPHQDHNHAN